MSTALQPININEVIFEEHEYAYPYFSSIRTELFGSLGRRGDYLWEWVVKAAQVTSLKRVEESDDEDLSNEIKRWGVLWDVIVDDVADEMDIERAESLLPFLISWNRDKTLGGSIEDRYVQYSYFVMDSVFKSLEELPGYETHKADLRAHYELLFNTMSFSLDLRRGSSKIDFKKYQERLSHNMHMMINGIIDLMKLDYPTKISDSADLKKLLWNGQRMGRIGNAATTFARELPVGDFSSDVVPLSVDLGVISMEQVNTLRNYVESENFKEAEELAGQLIKSIKNENAASILWDEWSQLKSEIEELIPKLPDLDIEGYVKGLIQLRNIHEMSEGSK